MSRLTRHAKAREDYLRRGGSQSVARATDKVAGQIAQQKQNDQAAREENR